MAIKLDMGKPYDKLKWPFIQEMPEEAKLPQEIITMIMECIGNKKLNILWHGEKNGRLLTL